MSRFVVLIAVVLLCACQPNTDDDPNAPFPAPDFTLLTLDGTTFTLSEQRGRWVIINFWATWCAPCVQEMPALDRVAIEHAESLAVIGINVREPADAVRAFIAELGVGFPIGINPPDSVLLDYNVIGLPQTVVIDTAGRVVWRQFGPLDDAGFTALLEQTRR